MARAEPATLTRLVAASWTAQRATTFSKHFRLQPSVARTLVLLYLGELFEGLLCLMSCPFDTMLNGSTSYIRSTPSSTNCTHCLSSLRRPSSLTSPAAGRSSSSQSPESWTSSGLCDSGSFLSSSLILAACGRMPRRVRQRGRQSYWISSAWDEHPQKHSCYGSISPSSSLSWSSRPSLTRRPSQATCQMTRQILSTHRPSQKRYLIPRNTNPFCLPRRQTWHIRPSPPIQRSHIHHRSGFLLTQSTSHRENLL